ncbi:(2Fe-2S)-binding protein [Kitasatospora terrestris]|uniref:(2Fe-2S)-binding protein n=1 Tax=Kitasatospora terrestris TaxID=258051 RepID=A0ABP9DGZ8_9ACTN
MTASSVEPRPAAPGRAAPLAGSWARLSAALPGLRIHGAPPRSGGGWTAAADLAGGGAALDAMIAFDAELGLELYGRAARPDVTAGFCLHRYTWPLALAFTVPWFLERRVPRLPVERVSVNRSTGELTAQPVEFACLPDDPAAAAPGARVVPDEAALRAELLAAVAEHLTPVLAAFRPRVRRGPHTLWAMTTDDVVEGLWYVGGLLGEEDRATAELDALLPAGPGHRPFVGAAGFRRADGRWLRDRVSCCLYYTVRPEEACLSCPREK